MGVSEAILVVLATFIGGVIARGWALSVLWGWFIVPTFRAPNLGIVPAIGLAAVVSYLTWQSEPDIDERYKAKHDARYHMWRALGLAFGVPFVSVAFGWVVHLFM